MQHALIQGSLLSPTSYSGIRVPLGLTKNFYYKHRPPIQPDCRCPTSGQPARGLGAGGDACYLIRYARSRDDGSDDRRILGGIHVSLANNLTLGRRARVDGAHTFTRPGRGSKRVRSDSE